MLVWPSAHGRIGWVAGLGRWSRRAESRVRHRAVRPRVVDRFDAATLPLSFYRGFLLERRYGLSTETIRHWLTDHAKAVLIGVLFAECASLFVYFVLRHWPAAWWALAGGGYAVVAIALVNLAPVVLLPLFFTFKPLEKDALRDRLTALASKAGTRIMGVYEWTLSDRTKKANAALTGMGHTRRILLSDTLLAEYSDDEIEVILAHELAHHVHQRHLDVGDRSTWR